MAFLTKNNKKNKNQKNSNPDSKKQTKKGAQQKRFKANSRLEFGYWWITHKHTVKVVGVITAFAVFGSMLLYGIYGLLNYYVFNYSEIRKLYQPRDVSLNWQYVSRISTPADLQIQSVKVLRSDGNYDLVTQVTNPNQKWYAKELAYHFEFGGEPISTKTGYVLPGRSTYLAELNRERPGGAARAELIIENIEWEKQSGFEALAEKFLRFEISDVSYIPAQQTDIEGDRPINQVKFTIKNSSPQNFWDIDVFIFLYAGTQMRAVNKYHINSLDSLEQRQVVINWPGSLPAINKVSVVPQLDILDPSVYKGFGEVTGEEK